MSPDRRLLVSADVRRAVIAHARRDAPRECCGLLIGRPPGVAFAMPLRNVHRTPQTRFLIDVREHIEARRWLRRLVPALEIVGVYHSHPLGSAKPSERDLTEALYPDWLYAVVGLRGGRATCSIYRIRNGRSTRVSVTWEDRGGRLP